MAGTPPIGSIPTRISQVPPQILEEYFKRINITAVQCMLCGNLGEYHINPIIYEIRPFFQGGIALGGNIPTVPVILIHCKKCGDTRFISTIITQMTPKVMTFNEPAKFSTDDKDPLNGR